MASLKERRHVFHRHFLQEMRCHDDVEGRRRQGAKRGALHAQIVEMGDAALIDIDRPFCVCRQVMKQCAGLRVDFHELVDGPGPFLQQCGMRSGAPRNAALVTIDRLEELLRRLAGGALLGAPVLPGLVGRQIELDLRHETKSAVFTDHHTVRRPFLYP